jgi:hypothetical protein
MVISTVHWTIRCDLPWTAAQINQSESSSHMGLFKSDLFRSMAFGFIVGAVIVFSTLGIDAGSKLANGVAPPAEAAISR